MINNIISKSKEIIHEIWKDKRKRYISLFIIFTICFFLFDLGGLLKNVWTNLMGLSDYTEEVKSVVLKSDGYDDKTPGSYQVTKSAKWTSDTSAKITFDVDTNVKYEEKNLDIILVIDISGSMEGARIEQVRIDTLDLVESALSTGNNRVALIEFATLSNIVSDFTTDSDLLLGELENLEIDTSIVENKVTENGQTTIYRYQGVTNYYRALLSVDEILSDYQQTSNREVVVVFLTDGLPCYETPNEVGQYKALKEKYPYITIQGIQYEMGYTVLDEVKNISDKQYIANMITLNNILFKSVEAVEYYDTFEIVDYINNDYYYVESKDDIKVPFGSVTLTEEDGVQKITWTVPDNTFLTGTKAKMEIDVKLQEQEENVEGYYPTNTKEEIKATLQNGNKINITSSETPVLKYGYKVTYDANLPSDCNETYSYSEIQPAYKTVELTDNIPKCEGYQFKGWETTSNLKLINNNIFTMPESDITFKATWSKLYLNKTQDGIVYENVCSQYYIGEEIAIGDEKFNVISEDCETVTMLTQGGLMANCDGDGHYCQSGSMKIYQPKFTAGFEYTPGPKEIDLSIYNSSLLNHFIYGDYGYVGYIQELTGAVNVSGTYITLAQLGDLGCTINDDYSYTEDVTCANSKHFEWLSLADMLTRSAVSNMEDTYWGVYDGNLITRNISSSVLRPFPRVVITISKDVLFPIGKKVTIGTEKFNVISDNGDTITLLAQYNLDTTYRQSKTLNTIAFSDVVGWELNSSIDIQLYDGPVKTYTNEYVSYIKKKTGESNISGTILTSNEYSSLNVEENSSWLINGQPFWLRTSNFNNGEHVCYVSDTGSTSCLGGYLYADGRGIRPVITISRSTLLEYID